MISETTDNSRESRTSNFINDSYNSSFSNSSEINEFIFTYSKPSKIIRSSPDLLQDHTFKAPKKKKHNTIRDYEKLCFLGKGPYSKVYLCNKLNTNKKVALKVLNKEFIENVIEIISLLAYYNYFINVFKFHFRKVEFRIYILKKQYYQC